MQSPRPAPSSSQRGTRSAERGTARASCHSALRRTGWLLILGYSLVITGHAAAPSATNRPTTGASSLPPARNAPQLKRTNPNAPAALDRVFIPPEITREANRLLASGAFESIRDLQSGRTTIRPRELGVRMGGYVYLDVMVFDNHDPTCLAVMVRYRGRRDIDVQEVTCRVAGKEMVFMPDWGALDVSQERDGTVIETALSSHLAKETMAALRAMVSQQQPVTIRMRGKAENHDFTLKAEDLRRLRESVVIWRAKGGAW